MALSDTKPPSPEIEQIFAAISKVYISQTPNVGSDVWIVQLNALSDGHVTCLLSNGESVKIAVDGKKVKPSSSK